MTGKLSRRNLIKILGSGCFLPKTRLSNLFGDIFHIDETSPIILPEFLGRVNDTSATVHLLTSGLEDIRIRVNRKEQLLYKQKNEHSIFEINNLRPNSLNKYQIVYKESATGFWKELPLRKFRTPRAPGEEFTAYIISDSHLMVDFDVFEPNLAGLQNAVNIIKADQPDLVFFMGDEYWAPYKWDLWQVDLKFLSQMELQKVSNYLLRSWRNHLRELFPNQMTLFIQGNHDGEVGFFKELNTRNRLTDLRRLYIPQPTHETYLEGGESADFKGHKATSQGPLQNYYGFRWGDVFFSILDVMRYSTNPTYLQNGNGNSHPEHPRHWTYGKEQLNWLKKSLKYSQARANLILTHHLAGGWPFRADGQSMGAYGRGGAIFSNVGEHRRIHKLAAKYGHTHFIRGHDHHWVVEEKDGVKYICAGKPNSPSYMFSQAAGENWNNAFPEDSLRVSGITRITVKPTENIIVLDYIRTDYNYDRENYHEGGLGEIIATTTLPLKTDTLI